MWFSSLTATDLIQPSFCEEGAVNNENVEIHKRHAIWYNRLGPEK